MKKTIFLISVISVISGWAFPQKITNITQKIENGRVVIHYDLSGDKSEIFNISVTASKESGPLFMGSTMTDGGTITPTVIAGRLENVKPGKDHFIWWEPVLELRDLHGWTIGLKAMLGCVDIDGNTYETIQIGDQLWTTTNLKVTHYRNGDAIPTGYSNSEWADLDDTETGAYAVYDNNESNADTYGYLYNWYAVDDTRNIAPEGWHIPTEAEWQELEDYLGGSSVAGGKMKEAGTTHWNSPNTGATNESGFIALPGGYRSLSNGGYNGMGSGGYFWSSTEDGSSAWGRVLYYDYSGGPRSNYS